MKSTSIEIETIRVVKHENPKVRIGGNITNGMLAQVKDNLNRNRIKKARLSLDGTTNFTLRVPKTAMLTIDKKRKERMGKVSRNTWILEAIEYRLKNGC